MSPVFFAWNLTSLQYYEKESFYILKHFSWIFVDSLLCFQAPSKLLKQPLSNLVEYLTEGLEDDLSKVRAIYRWVTCQPVDSMKIPNKEPSQSHTMFQLWRIKHRKGNYAQLISLLCRYVDIFYMFILHPGENNQSFKEFIIIHVQIILYIISLNVIRHWIAIIYSYLLFCFKWTMPKLWIIII